MTPKPQPQLWLLTQKSGQAQINFPPTYKFDKYSAQGLVCNSCRVCETMPRMWHNSVPSEMLPVALGGRFKKHSLIQIVEIKFKYETIFSKETHSPFLTKFQPCNQCKMLLFATLVPLKPKGFSLSFPQSSPGCLILLACGLLLFPALKEVYDSSKKQRVPSWTEPMPSDGSWQITWGAFFLGDIIFVRVFFSSQKYGDHRRRFHEVVVLFLDLRAMFFFVALKRGKI